VNLPYSDYNINVYYIITLYIYTNFLDTFKWNLTMYYIYPCTYVNTLHLYNSILSSVDLNIIWFYYCSVGVSYTAAAAYI